MFIFVKNGMIMDFCKNYSVRFFFATITDIKHPTLYYIKINLYRVVRHPFLFKNHFLFFGSYLLQNVFLFFF